MSRGVRLADAHGRAQTAELRADVVPHRLQLPAEGAPGGVELERQGALTGSVDITPTSQPFTHVDSILIGLDWHFIHSRLEMQESQQKEQK